MDRGGGGVKGEGVKVGADEWYERGINAINEKCKVGRNGWRGGGGCKGCGDSGGAGLVVSRRSGFAYSGCPIRQKVARPIMCISPRFILQS